MKKLEKKQLFTEHFGKAQKLHEKKMYANAIQEYKKANAIMPSDYLPIHNMGVAYFLLNDFKNSEKYLKKAYELAPNNPLTALNLGFLYYSQEKYNLAIKYLKKGIHSSEATDEIFNILCNALLKLGKYNDASKYLKQSIERGNIDSNIHLLLIDTFIKLEKFEDALSIINLVNMSDKNATKIQMQKTLIITGQEYIKKIKLKNKKQIKSLCEYIEEINKIKENNEDIYIYRGQNNKYLPLLPSLYRKKSFIEDENNIIQEFNLKAEAFFNQGLETFDNVDKIALMQHYGIPTRLLDFTESPLIALFFAIEKLSSDSYDRAPCVYAINTRAFTHNNNGFLYTSKQIAAESRNNTKIFKYSNGTCAFSPKLKSKRLTAQKGVFILFNENVPLELSINEENIIKFEFEREYINKIKQELNNIGITPSTVYPDFTGLAEEIKNPHKFIEDNSVLDIESKPFTSTSFLLDSLKKISKTSPSHS